MVKLTFPPLHCSAVSFAYSFADKCVFGENMYDRCGRMCECVNGKFINCCRRRMDYAGLSREDRLQFITTYQTVVRDPVYGPRYAALVNTFTGSFANNITQSTSPTNSQYFMFNRYYMLEFEDMLRDFNCSITIPFYDWTPFPDAPYSAAVWGNTDGFGDRSRQPDLCVTTGPFRVGEYSVLPSAGGGCLQREYQNKRFPSRDIIERDVLTIPSDRFFDFHRFLHLFIGVNIQCFIGGTMCSPNVANDPVYLLHIARLDSILMRWQSLRQGRDTVRYAFDGSPLLETPGFLVRDFSDNFVLPYGTCVLYTPPVLKKRHPPPSAIQTLGSPVSLRTMDCAPESSMGFVGMSVADHDFMEEHCKKVRVFRSIRDVPTKN